MTQYVMIAIGGAAGAIARYMLALWIQQRTASLFPFGTFVVNISGCLVMGISMTLLTEKLTVSAHWRFLIPVGFIGPSPRSRRSNSTHSAQSKAASG